MHKLLLFGSIVAIGVGLTKFFKQKKNEKNQNSVEDNQIQDSQIQTA